MSEDYLEPSVLDSLIDVFPDARRLEDELGIPDTGQEYIQALVSGRELSLERARSRSSTTHA
jgi:hypothetical protein